LPDELKKQAPSYCYDYGIVVFLAGVLSGVDVSAWLLNKGGTVNGCDFQYRLQQTVTDVQLNWTRHPSYASIGFAKTEYPFTLYNMLYHSNEWGLPTGFLVGDHCPFFPSIQTAISQLIYGITDPHQNRSTSEAASIRIFHTAARIKHVEISPTLLTVEVNGTDLVNTRLRISGPPELQFDERVSQAGYISCPLPNGMPPDVWIVLSCGNKWLDYSYLSQRWSPFREKQDNVMLSPPDIRIQIQEFIAQGEGPTIEFKRHISDDGGTALKTVAAFANDEGGVILLGVDDRNGDVVGIAESVSRTKDSVTDLIRRKVVPEPQIRFENCDIDGRQVIAVFVERGNSPPYGINPEKPEFYVRRGATTFPAKQEEIVALAQSSIKKGSVYQPWIMNAS
jgi:hypothetical protein